MCINAQPGDQQEDTLIFCHFFKPEKYAYRIHFIHASIVIFLIKQRMKTETAHLFDLSVTSAEWENKICI